MRPARLPQQRPHRQGGARRRRGRARAGPPPRPGRGRHAARRGHRPRLPPALDHRPRQQPPAAAVRRRALLAAVQRRDLQLRGAARAAGPRARRELRHRRRRRDHPRRVPVPRRGLRPRAARDVRLPDLGHRGAGAVRGAGLVRDQAAVHDDRRARHLLRLREEVAARARRPRRRRGAGHPLAAALPDPAVRPRAGDDAPADPPGGERHRVPAAPGRRAADLALLPAELPDPGRRRRAAALRRGPRGGRGLRRQAHARGRHRRRVPVRRHRLDRHRRAGEAAQPAADHLHHRLPAAGLQRGRRRREVGGGARRHARSPGR